MPTSMSVSPSAFMFRRAPLALALALSFAGAAQAQGPSADAELAEVLVTTAAGFEQKPSHAPASISVISREELEKRPYMTLIDAVRDLEGVDVGETSDKTGQRTVSLRGMGAEYTLILIDGKRQNNHGDIYPNSFGGNQFNHIPPLDTIERIEVIRGPASTLYGADALGGVINIITKPTSSKWSGSATFGRTFQENDAFGDDITFDFASTGPLIKDKLGLAIRGAVYERLASNPEYDPVTDPSGVTHVRALGFGDGGRTVDNTNINAGGTLSWSPTVHQRMTFDYDISRQEYDNTPIYDPETGTVSYPLGTLDGIDSIWRASGGKVQPRVGYSKEQKFERDQWALTHRGDWDSVKSFVSLAWIATSNEGRTMPFSVAERLHLQEIYDGTGAYAGLSVNERKAIAAQTFLPRPKRKLESSQYTLDARLDIPVENFVGRHRFVVGGQVIDGELEDGVFGLEASEDGKQAVSEQKQWSLFAEDNWTPVEPLTLTVGVRHDQHDVFGSQLSPRAYAVWDVHEDWVLKGGVSTGYKTPKTSDLYDGITGFGGQGTNPWTGNPDLKPETSVNSEVALYWNSPRGHNFNVTWFQNDFKDKIDRQLATQPCSVTGGVRPCANLGSYYEVLAIGTLTQPVNIDDARNRGIEVAGRYQVIPALSLRLNYTYLDSEQRSGANKGLPLGSTARHMGNAHLDWSITDRLSTRLSYELRSKRFDSVDGTTGEPRYYKDYGVFHLSGQFRVNEHVTLNGRVNNLLDEDFTSYKTNFVLDETTGEYTPNFVDDYNNKDKARNYWVSVNVRF